MLRQMFRRFVTTRQSVRPTRRPAQRRPRFVSRMEGLEHRVMLSGTPTVYTIVNTDKNVVPVSSTSGSLAWAVSQANNNTNPAGSVIEFNPTTFSTPQTIIVLQTLVLNESAGGPEMIDGPGVGLLSISGSNLVQVIQVAAGATAAISGVTITGGHAASSGPDANGGGIDNEGMLTVSNCVIVGNTASGAGAGGGIYNNGPMTITGSTISDNSVSGGGFGGGISNQDDLTMTDCTVADNTVSGFGNGGGIDNENTLNATGCTFSSNATGTQGSGGGIFNQSNLVLLDSTVASNSAGYGGGIYNNGSLVVDVVNCTVAYNSASAAGNGGGLCDFGLLTVVNSTIAYNTTAAPDQGGGLYVGGGTATLDNSIIAQNTSGSAGTPDDLVAAGGGAVSPASADNLVGTGGSAGLVAGTNGNQVGVANSGLGPLANNGGPTATIALLPASRAQSKGSVALAVDPATGQPLTTDERGAGFVRTQSGAVDIGAFEVQPAVVVAVTVSWGIDSDALQTASDGLRLLPVGRNTDLPWLGIDALSVMLDEPETLTASEVSIVGITGINYGPVTVSGSGTSYRITFARPVEKTDRVTISIGGAGVTSFTRRLDILPGDFFDSGVVTSKDASAIKNESTRKHGAMPTIFGDVLGNGTVNSSDYKAARKFQGARLPDSSKPSGKRPKLVLARSSPFAPRKDEEVLSRSENPHALVFQPGHRLFRS